ncbi:hypothetical protein HZU73_10237 [Apis mellifera caucasica]|nr:hypothetical protein HZU73_10237 [Apis mellifera caucasica]
MIPPIYLLTLQQMNYLYQLPIIERSVKHLLDTSQFLNVLFVVQNSLDPLDDLDHLIDEIYKTVSRTIPTNLVSFNDSIPIELPEIDATESTLILYSYVAKDFPDRRRREDIARFIEHCQNRSKVLLVTRLEEMNCNFEGFLKQIWYDELIDMTVLELSPSKRSITMNVHRYNPFANVYDRSPYTPTLDWFPNKMTDLHGHPFRATVLEREGYVNLTVDSRDYPVSYKGPDVKLLRTLARIMNFTIVMQPNNDALTSLMDGDLDIIIPKLPLFPDPRFDLLDHTLPFEYEKWCPVVPITYQVNAIETRAFAAIIANIVILLAFWAVSALLRFERRLWQPLKIFGILIAASVSMRPGRTLERIVFFLVVLASTVYSANLYVDLTSVTMADTMETEYKSYEDLDESGLTPVVLHMIFNVTFFTDDQAFNSLKRKAIADEDMDDCTEVLSRYRNVTCFMELRGINALIYSQARRDTATMKVCRNLCYAEPHATYFLRKHSPFRGKFDAIISRLEAAGIRKKWHYDFVGKFFPKKGRPVKRNLYESSLVWNLVYIGVIGFLASIVAFFCEILVYRAHKRRKNRA